MRSQFNHKRLVNLLEQQEGLTCYELHNSSDGEPSRIRLFFHFHDRDRRSWAYLPFSKPAHLWSPGHYINLTPLASLLRHTPDAYLLELLNNHGVSHHECISCLKLPMGVLA